jgi:hypothetical protein
MKRNPRRNIEGGLGKEFDEWINSTTIEKGRELTVAKAAWVMAWNVGKNTKPLTCPGCDFSTAALSDCSDQLQAALAEVERLKAERWELIKAREEEFDRMLAENTKLQSDYDNLRARFNHFTERNRELWDENEGLHADVKLQREMLINYNTRGNLINWFGEFLLSKAPAQGTRQ